MNLIVIENSLMPVYESPKGEKVVSARELYKFLELADGQFSRWCKSNIIENMFANEGDDYVGVDIDVEGNLVKDFILKISFAKKLCMISKSKKGELVREYFIKLEEKFKQLQINTKELSPQLQIVGQLYNAMAAYELQQKQILEEQKRLAADNSNVKQIIHNIKETLNQQPNNWRDWVNRELNKVVKSTKVQDYQAIRLDSYKKLEAKAHCNLERRLNNLKKNLRDAGASETKINKANALDVIEDDPRLKEIYTSIVEKMSIKHTA